MLPLLIGLITLISFPLISSQPALADDTSHGAQIFATHCVGCHVNGGNIIRRNKTLKFKALQKNKMDSIDSIIQIVANGKANMSAYQDRLTAEEIKAVAAYVLDQANRDWR